MAATLCVRTLALPILRKEQRIRACRTRDSPLVLTAACSSRLHECQSNYSGTISVSCQRSKREILLMNAECKHVKSVSEISAAVSLQRIEHSACKSGTDFRHSDGPRQHAAMFLGVALGVGVLFGCNVEAAEAASMAVRERVPLESDMTALALGEPLMEEFWDNMRRYLIYFFTVASGGLYSVIRPVTELLKSPVTGVLVVLALGGGFYLTYLTVGAMLGIGSTDFAYEYSPYIN